MNVSKNNANITMPFPANFFPMKMIIHPNFHFCLNTHLIFPLIFWVLTSRFDFIIIPKKRLAFSKLSDKFSPNQQNSSKQAASPNLQISMTDDSVKYIWAKSSKLSLILVAWWVTLHASTRCLLSLVLGYSRKTPNRGFKDIYTFLNPLTSVIFRFLILPLENSLSPLRILENCVKHPDENSKVKS